jgi:alkylated DNA repair dioxygenase AlkB
MSEKSKRKQVIEVGELHLEYFPDFWDADTAERAMKLFLEKIQWRSETVKMYGREIECKRKTALYGNDYGYGGMQHAGLPFPAPDKVQERGASIEKWLATLKNDAELLVGPAFASMLFNLYPDGGAGIGWHRDKGDPVAIASLSLGAARTFELALVGTTKAALSMQLKSGSLLVLPQSVNRIYKHRVPKTKKKCGPRVNVTMRSFA